MKNWLRRSGIVCIVGFALLVGLSYTGTGQAVADISCKLTHEGSNAGVPAEFHARVKNAIDPLWICLDTTGNGCSISVPDSNATYEVRCFPYDVTHGMVCENVPREVAHPTPIVTSKRLLIVSGNGEANFTCKNHQQVISTYTDAQ